MKLDQPKSAMLMAAGLGTRMRPFSDLLPKPLLPVLGIPVAQYALDRLAEAGVSRVVANVHHHAERMRAGLAALDLHGMSLAISDESELLLGSAGGLRRALPLLEDGPFFLVNSDVLFDIDLARLAAAHRVHRERFGARITLTVFQRSPGDGEYREVRVDPATGMISGLGEKRARVPFFASVAVIESEAIRGLPENQPLELVPLVLEPAIREGKAGAYVTQGEWHDIGSPGLWLETHLSALRGLETGAWPRPWRLRVESVNRRVGQLLWVSNEAPRWRLPTAHWAGPAYWSPAGDRSARPPRELGPRAVAYGELRGREGLADGIAFGGLVAHG